MHVRIPGTGCLAVRQTGRLHRQLVEFPMQTPPVPSFSRSRGPSFVSSQSHALSSSFKLYLCPPRFLVLPLLSFLPFLFDTPTLGKESRDIPDIFAFSDSTAGSILLGKFLSVVFCGEHRWDRGTWIKLPSGTRLVWYASKDLIDFDLAGCFFFFLLARFLFRPFHSNVHEEK